MALVARGEAPAAKRPSANAKEPLAKRPAANLGDIKVVHRAKPEPKVEAYIMEKGKFVVSLAKRKTDTYHNIINELANEMRDGKVKGKDAAKARLVEPVGGQ